MKFPFFRHYPSPMDDVPEQEKVQPEVSPDITAQIEMPHDLWTSAQFGYDGPAPDAEQFGFDGRIAGHGREDMHNFNMRMVGPDDSDWPDR